MNKLTYNNYDYNIVDKFEASDIEGFNKYDVIETNKTIIKKKFAFLPYFINGKFVWLSKVTLRYRLYFSRKLEFNDGWSYQNYWTKLKPEWKLDDIIN